MRGIYRQSSQLLLRKSFRQLLFGKKLQNVLLPAAQDVCLHPVSWINNITYKCNLKDVNKQADISKKKSLSITWCCFSLEVDAPFQSDFLCLF